MPALISLRRKGPNGTVFPPATRERELGSDRRDTGQRYPTDEVEFATVIEVSTRGILPFRFLVHAASSKANAAKLSSLE